RHTFVVLLPSPILPRELRSVIRAGHGVTSASPEDTATSADTRHSHENSLGGPAKHGRVAQRIERRFWVVRMVYSNGTKLRIIRNRKFIQFFGEGGTIENVAKPLRGGSS
ncbi:MAG: hypothetical protein KDA80_04845, partial [Planctomycetaceae bacterium]|nr:hypothetical protein [Planctomycetaceae bacterium]